MKINKNLLFIYGEDARIRINDLSKLLKTSSQHMKYLLNSIEKRGFLIEPYCIFDYSYFNLILFRVYFKGAYISDKDKSETIDQLAKNEYVVSIYELSGEFDLVIEIEAPNPSRFNKVLKAIIEANQTLRNFKIVLNIVSYLYPRFYLPENTDLGSHIPSYKIIGGDRQYEKFNLNELQIIKNLLHKPCARMATLAKLSSINIKTAKAAFLNLQKRGIIRGFKYAIDNNKLSIYRSRLFLKLHNLNKESEEKLLEYLLRAIEIIRANKTVGDWDLEVDIESFDKTRIRQVVIEIRDLFRGIIENFNIMEFHCQYKMSYLPKYYFEQELK
ncbi:MAG: Lrp/AsnC ligand binding domain-containing protein [Nanoarchaeota archaeon]